MRDFDAEIVDLLETEPLVTGVYRVNPNEDRFGLYAVRVEPGTAKEPTEVLRDKIFDTLGASLDVNFVEEIDVAWTPLWERGVDDFESASYAEDYEKMHGRPPRDLQVTFGDTDRVLTGVDQHGTPMTEVVHCGAPKPPRRRLPTIEELIAHNRAHLLRERNALIAEDGLRATSHHEGRLTDRIDLHEWITMSLTRAVDAVNGKLQGGLWFLATVGSASPFVEVTATARRSALPASSSGETGRAKPARAG